METETLQKKEIKAVPKLRFKEFEGIYSEEMLKKIFSIFNGYAFSSKDSKINGVRWIKIADVGINEMKKDTPSFLPHNYIQKHSKFILKKGDFVVALTRPILNKQLKIAEINDLFNDSLLNQRVGKLVSPNHLPYIYYTLQRHTLISRIENRIAGTDPPNLSPAVIGSLKTYIPNIQEQQKIASSLSSVDKKIQQLTRKKELLETYKKGVMQQLFSHEIRFKPALSGVEGDEDGKDFPEWERKNLGEISKYLKGFAFKSVDYKTAGIRVVRVSDLSQNKIKTNGEQVFIGMEKANEFEKYKLKRGNIIITTVGSKPELLESAVGRGIYINNENEGLLNQNMLKFENIEGVDNRFVFCLINSKKYQSFIKKIARGNANQANITVVDLLKFKVLIPSLKEQQKIADFLSGIDKKIEAVQQQIEKTQSFKKGLLQQMFV